MTTLDLNADMGEGFGAWRIGGDIDDRIMAGISSANIATGFHAVHGHCVIFYKRVEKPQCVGATAHAGDQRIG